MNKSTTNKITYNQEILSILSEKYAVTKQFVKLAIREQRMSERAEMIKKDYRRFENKMTAILDTERSKIHTS